ncbi:DUF4054 domain-containing protein [Burkholderia cenocepacia]|uniref:Head-to-tail connector complex protein n=1 Tax=Burkholderia phage Magia TaxID=2767577 RepID=A0A873WLY9_9CAUD|nr:DUF4054 domain-containing protein [Burkholderia cenocepacia]YP_010668105.1 virion structural protein [Burkholderia phage Magia]MBJ9897404.1 DUF4054 domain-containing protein [Burkholderia cenocepacia]MBJ9913977.1 DUF4054 domain-containing protein [Burkholderia cenocepacia]MBR8097660.1 DUF4054 domain-containing protein [Burkholderia cenocepacia]MDI9683563.1 DUF4054 domain-containing protein [Burkholderia cenocepacia]QPB08691.1 head-to-tail connector complex protein [Burkholderia phage Magia
MDVSQFRQSFPEFNDTTTYPDSLVQFWMTVAVSLVNAERWGELTDLGVALVTAHHLALAVKDQKMAAVGGVPGQVTGPQSSKAVDKVSASYDTSAVAIKDGGFWNATMYGVRYLSLAMMMGAGGMQL